MGFKPVSMPASAKAPSTPEKPAASGVSGGGMPVMPEKSGLLTTLSAVPKDGLVGHGAAERPVAPERSRMSIASSDSDSEGNPRTTLVRAFLTYPKP